MSFYKASFADSAFAAPNLKCASQLSGLDIRPDYQQLELLFKPSMLDVPIFRKSFRTAPHAHPDSGITLRMNLIRASRADHFNIDDVTDAPQNMMLQHASIDNFIKHYLPRRSGDIRAIVPGYEPQKDLMRTASRMTRWIDPGRPHALAIEQSQSVDIDIQLPSSGGPPPNDSQAYRPPLRPGGICVGCIVWLPNKENQGPSIKCRNDGCCENVELKDEGYNHPVVVLKIKQKKMSKVVFKKTANQSFKIRMPNHTFSEVEVRIWAAKYDRKPLEFWKRLGWSDECSIDRGKGGAIEWVYLMEGDQNARRGVTARVYIEVLEEYLPTILDSDWIFMQDNARIHKAYLVREWFIENNIDIMDWPPYSPE
ncbi:uncharacterized protein RAG0_12547 [Rhynchosporium agropyri]|uniref:Tc1-like transposase DDE domain-containing protein n=1 Tax=Rhynchosporium agropyri TaxID=914238 RepID=A0A1E1L903_9HELO|nr:uncharacterized protein RAG0_12547 [Rhynchosporium agropyri]